MLAALLVAVVVAAVGGGVGGAAARRNKEHSAIASGTLTPTPSTPTNTTSAARYANTGLAAMQWTDQKGTLHKQVYYQDKDSKM